MAPPPPFAVEQWMNKYETTAQYNLAETCCASLSLDELAALNEAGTATASTWFDTTVPQTYGEILGDVELRQHLSRLYSTKVGTPLQIEQVIITPGAIAANFLVFYALVGPGDHVICHYPTYQQLYSVPASLGADVDLWRSDPDKDWLPDLEALKAMVKDNTKLIILNNPQNPTGRVLPRALLQELIDFVEPRGIAILSDEVYRPVFHGITAVDSSFPPSILSLGYARTIATGSLSKAYGLAGIRVGWAATRSAELAEAIAAARDYTTISVSRLDQRIAAAALAPETIHALLGRNITLARENLAMLERFVIKHDESCSWVKPVAGTTAFVKFTRDGRPIDAAALCRTLQEKTGVMFLPGDVGFGAEFKGYVRIGFVNRTDVVRDGLEEARKFMRKEYDDIPLAE